MGELARLLFENVGAVIAIIVVLTLSIIAIFKVSVQFDLNEFLKARKKRHARKAQHYCAHMEFQDHKDGLMCISLFESPSGTNQWICKTCQLIINNFNQEEQKRNSEYWLKNPSQFKRNIRKYNYHAKRAI